jgi:hypothetical protein
LESCIEEIGFGGSDSIVIVADVKEVVAFLDDVE